MIEAELPLAGDPVPMDLSREPLRFPADRATRLQNLARGDEGYLLALGYSTQRGYANSHPFAGEIRMGEVPLEIIPEELGFAINIGEITLTECQMVNQFAGSSDVPPQFTRGYGLAFGDAERKAMAMALVDRALRADELGEEIASPAQDPEFVLSHTDNVEASGFVQHLKLPHYVDFQAELELVRKMRSASAKVGVGDTANQPELRATERERGMNGLPGYNFAYLDEQTKRMIRRAMLKAVADPRLPGALRLAARCPCPMAGAPAACRSPPRSSVGTTCSRSSTRARTTPPMRSTSGASSPAPPVWRRPRAPAKPPSSRPATAFPRTPLTEEQILVYQVPMPEPLSAPGAARSETASCTRWREYGLMHVKLYEDIARYGHIATCLRLSGDGQRALPDVALADPEVRQPQAAHEPGAATVSAPAARSALYAIPPYTPVAQPGL